MNTKEVGGGGKEGGREERDETREEERGRVNKTGEGKGREREADEKMEERGRCREAMNFLLLGTQRVISFLCQIVEH